MEITDKKNFCIILAGGRGRRLWPVSREQYPKQFVDLFGTGKTQLQATFDRFARLLPKENIYICTCREYLHLVQEQLPEVTEHNTIVEPIHRNTAPSVAWATMRILRQNNDANIIISPSDQLVLDEASFSHSMDVGVGYVSENNVLLAMGVKPTRPEPGYGYIQLGDLSCKPEVYKVKSFTEKPERDFAKMFMESGEFYWNTGIFIASARHLIENFKYIFPAVLRNLNVEKPNYTYEEELVYVEENYPRYPNLSLDYAILEQSQEVFVMKCNFGWADLGTWHAIYEVMTKVKDDNVVLDSQVLLEDCHNNIIRLPKGKLGVFNGLEGYIVAEEGDVLMICKKSDNSSMVKKYVNEVRLKYGEEFV
ncbi:mannose-1-phosphate guanylyltransferase [Xylanibacter ruminicola]|jgi:mannose-1-phosphate guanylyltransferase|uniref:Mannose-1-phosphate guanylyltransferase n=1 Tax=Xylanibacter ruminicola TaxID=839 RepID=A0A1H5XFS0_XYLRU|nr:MULTISPECIES: sugar phosphate nucleotidyltransferase [Prevotellaceae]SEG10592.1 mannose-1-phosphate guanylyltransferase [Xylanibacter ruminicola]SEW02436.1 mannose-1-phosphate guanylyltransferase [Prevotella sp. khp7]